MEELSQWVYDYTHIPEKACLDIEKSSPHGSITVLSMYYPAEGVISCTTLVKGKDLDTQHITRALQGIKLLITYSGLKFDVPAIEKEFPGSIPRGIKHIDVYLLAKKLGLGASLKTVERTLRVERPASVDTKIIASRLWKKYQNQKNARALELLIIYNQQDAVNLYPLTEQLISLAKKKQ